MPKKAAGRFRGLAGRIAGMEVATEHLSHSGLTYELTARVEPGGYYGAWFCEACRTGGVKYELFSSIADAIAHAKCGAIAHHDSAHCSNGS